MQQSHAGSDKLFVDYADDPMPVIVDRLTGKARPAQIFVAVLRASNSWQAEPRPSLIGSALIPGPSRRSAGCRSAAASPPYTACGATPEIQGRAKRLLWKRGSTAPELKCLPHLG